jgi:hypothetical protein
MVTARNGSGRQQNERTSVVGAPEKAMRVLRWALYISIFVGTSAMSFSKGLWPPGGPDTIQARDVAKLLLAVIGVVGVSVGIVYLTAPRFP